MGKVVLLTVGGWQLEAKSSTIYLNRGMGGLNGRLVALLHTVQRHYGRKVVVVSGCRSRNHNRKIGGARESYHLRCMAADIVVLNGDIQATAPEAIDTLGVALTIAGGRITHTGQ